jgi:prepilin-type N-terminal cleavage/methylation domain-containing protein
MRVPRGNGRPAFTLIELLVVIFLILLLAALAAAFYPDISRSNRSSTGASSLQGWLLIAKQRAKRDGLPTGIRFITGENGGFAFCTQMVYIQQPPDFAVGRCTATSSPNTTPMTATLNTNVQASQYTQAGYEDQFDVQNGDYFELYGGSYIRQIFSVTASPSSTTLSMLPAAGRGQSMPVLGTSTSPVVPTTGLATNPGPNYRIIRQPRELPGEPILTLPYNIAIDMNKGSNVGGIAGNTQTFSNPPTRTSLNPTSSYSYREIVFSPAGAVVGAGNQNPYDGQIYLWVRDIAVPDISSDPEQGYPTIVSVQTRSGFISAYPVTKIPSTTTTLTAAITTLTQTTITVASAAGINPNMVLQINSEQLQVTNIAGTTLTVVRAVNNTTAATHVNGATVSVNVDPFYYTKVARSSGL